MIARRLSLRQGAVRFLRSGAILLLLWACHGASEEANPRRAPLSASDEALRREPGLLGRPDSIGFVDLRPRTLAAHYLQYDSAMGRPALSAKAVTVSAFAPKASDLTDVWGTPIRILLFADSAIFASAGPTRRWEDSAGITVTAYYRQSDSTAMRTRARVMRNGQLAWVEWWLP